MAAFDAGGDLRGLAHHSDHGSNPSALVYADGVVDSGAVGSTGIVGDSYGNAMAEAINALYTSELIRARGPWRTVEQVELATLEWVWRFKKRRLHSKLDYRTSHESENDYYADADADAESLVKAIASQDKTQKRNPRRFLESAFTWGIRMLPVLSDVFAGGPAGCGGLVRRERLRRGAQRARPAVRRS